MSICAPDPSRAKFKDAVLSVLILSAFAVGFLGTALVLGVEPRMFLERTAERTFRVTGSNHFAGYQFYSKTIEGVERATLASATRDRRSDSLEERRRQAKRKRLDFEGASGAVLSWDREDDSRLIDDFMRGDSATLSLVEKPPLWRMGLAWFCTAFAGLIFIGAIQSNFFPKNGSVRT